MLVLSRKIDEVILLTGGIKITIADIQRGKVKIGIEAPPEILVYREEIAPPGFVEVKKQPCQQSK